MADLAIVAGQATALNTGVVVINPGGNSNGVRQAGFRGERHLGAILCNTKRAYLQT